MTRIFLIRHAEAEGNIYRRAHGHHEGRVTGRGYQQIRLLRERFLNESIDAVYSSDLHRAMETAKALAEPRGLRIVKSKMLREVDLGEWEDKAWGDLEYADPQMSGYFSFDPERWSVGGGEAFSDVIRRATDFIRDTAERHDGQTIAFFSHGFTIRAFFSKLMGYASHEVSKAGYCDNTAVALLIFENGQLTIEYQRDNSHLSAESSTFAHQTWWRTERKLISENLRYMPLDNKRDYEMLKLYTAETGRFPFEDKAYAAFRRDEPIGLIGLDTSRRERREERGGIGESDYGWISCIFIRPESRRMNYGVQLLGLAISEYRRMRREYLRIKALRDSAAVGFCLKYGFEVVYETDEYLLMQKYIRNW